MVRRQDLRDDVRCMEIAVRMAARGLGRTSPNPTVGAVIVEPATGEIIARGWTMPGGRPHAEPEALRRAGHRAAGATLYVTLEPCSHHGRTPPCADAIIAAGIGRVVVGLEDPDPRVAGRGLARLREAGIDVTRGVLRDACHWLTLGHILRVTERRPFVQLKMALAADGSVSRGTAGAPTWVTGPDARGHGHLLRATADAIVIGHGTAVEDNPTLTCRLPGLLQRSPVRIVLGGSRPLPSPLALFDAQHPPVWWVTTGGSDIAPRQDRGSCETVAIVGVAGRPWLPALMEELVARGITRLLVEGGPTIWRAFDRAGLVDEVCLFHARPAGIRPLDDARVSAHLHRYVSRTPLRRIAHRMLANDDMIVFRRR